jgi:hypothetical protein
MCWFEVAVVAVAIHMDDSLCHIPIAHLPIRRVFYSMYVLTVWLGCWTIGHSRARVCIGQCESTRSGAEV